MRFVALLAVASAPFLVVAHGDDLAERAYNMRRHLMERQGPTSSTTPPAATSPAGPSPLPPSTTSVSGSTNSTIAPPTVVLASTNPTAVPLSLIRPLNTSSPTKGLPVTPTAGTTPLISGAPRLPDVSRLSSANYPPLDAVPPTDSDEVKRWIAEINATGIVIPGLSQTVAGGCAVNGAVALDPDRCWWSCTGCTRKTDITDCPTNGDWGLTYDDGPGNYTTNLLEYLDSQRLKSTFFVVGSRVLTFPSVLQYEYINGHQIAVHTWSHHSLTQLTDAQIVAELGWSKKIIKDVLGVTPNMMRPPFGDIDNRVRAISLAMGLTPVMWTRISPQVTFDTDDFDIHGGTVTANDVLRNWQNILGNITTVRNGFIVLEHDLFRESVEVATGYILPDALAHNPPFSIKPVVSCRGLGVGDAYIETNDNRTHPPALAAAVTQGDFSTTSVRQNPTATPKAGSSGVDHSVPVFGLVAALTGMFAAVPLL